jgi:hypothetical protein
VKKIKRIYLIYILNAAIHIVILKVVFMDIVLEIVLKKLIFVFASQVGMEHHVKMQFVTQVAFTEVALDQAFALALKVGKDQFVKMQFAKIVLTGNVLHLDIVFVTKDGLKKIALNLYAFLNVNMVVPV